MAQRSRGALIATLGSAQMLAWGSSYYLPAILAQPMAASFGLSVSTVFAAFSAALIITALAGPIAGRTIDRLGGRPVLMTSSLLFATGLILLALAHHVAVFFAGWLVLGLGMACGLYEAAFASLVRLYGHNARSAMTGIALLGGLASTVGWPISGWLNVELGWRGACLVWATIHIVVGMPLNALLPRLEITSRSSTATNPTHATETAAEPDAPPLPAREARRILMLLAIVFSSTLFISTAMGAHLPRLLQGSGLTLAAAVGIAALVGPAQVVGRLFEFHVLRRVHPLISARLAAATHPIGAVALLIFGAGCAPLFAILHGLGNGILTIATGLLPLALFGSGGYGARQGWLMVPARVAQAFAPLLFGLSVEQWGTQALWVSSAVGVLAMAALFAISQPSRTTHHTS